MAKSNSIEKLLKTKASMKESKNPSALERLNSRLSKFDYDIIQNKATERAFSGDYTDTKTKGYYVCKRCGNPLFISNDKFHSGCGWSSFDDELSGTVKRQKDADDSRIEILCNNCGAHLGHEFIGEGYTDKNKRHCVNSASLTFIPQTGEVGKAVFAGGCFWGVEHYLEQLDGVEEVVSGYMGGHINFPSYQEVSQGQSGHLEVVEVTYNKDKVSFEEIAKLFFEIHDFEQTNGQGPDIGKQYLSAIFYYNQSQKNTAEKIIETLSKKNYKVATSLKKAESFWPAEDYHQNYYKTKNGIPYCHSKKKIF